MEGSLIVWVLRIARPEKMWFHYIVLVSSQPEQLFWSSPLSSVPCIVATVDGEDLVSFLIDGVRLVEGTLIVLMLRTARRGKVAGKLSHTI